MNPFAGDLPAPDSQEFNGIGDCNSTTRTDPSIVGDNASLKIAVEGENGPGMQPLNIDYDANHAEPQGMPRPARLLPLRTYYILAFIHLGAELGSAVYLSVHLVGDCCVKTNSAVGARAVIQYRSTCCTCAS